MTPEDRWAKISRERLEEAVTIRVASLRKLADKIEQEAARSIANADDGKYEWSTYTRVASQMVDAVTWGVANLNLSTVINAGLDADRARQGLKP